MNKTVYTSVCPVCQKTFETAQKKHKYCSAECYQSTRRTTEKKLYNCWCVMCGKGFQADDPDTLFCSEECRKRRGSPAMIRKP